VVRLITPAVVLDETRTDAVSRYWEEIQPGFKFTAETPGTPRFYEEVRRHRYSLEPHILELVNFPRWRGKDVLDVGCGIATDGEQFAQNGASYTGVDVTRTAIELAERRFELADLSGRFIRADATALPLPDAAFDLVYSHGVLHHLPDMQAALDEFHRVLKPDGKLIVMVYHRGSLNYHLTIMLVRRLLAFTLYVPSAPKLIGKLTGEDPQVLERHRQLLKQHGLNYLRKDLFLSNNTDGPGNPLSKVYSRADLAVMLRGFRHIQLQTRYLNLRIYPGGNRLEQTRLGRKLERLVGWHLYAEATKAG
jgi:ubiquinone/menaquinone biosynthesis C-methylase UbiE